MNKPKFAKIDNVMYKINTDFRVAIECDAIARNTDIGEYERALAIIYKLFGKEGLECRDRNKILNIAMKYISLGEPKEKGQVQENNKYKLDFNKCKGLISSSFKFDYNYDPYELEYLHWYDFYNDLENLSSNEFGTCCVLNRIINLFNYDTSTIKDNKERTKINKAKEELRKKYCYIEEPKMTKEQEESANEFYKALGII